jgi:VanZ family protein
MPLTRVSWHSGALLVYLLLVAYASLFPFWPWRLPVLADFSLLLRWPRHATTFDYTLNVLAYVPLGVLATLHAQRWRSLTASIVIATLLGLAIAGVLETAQLFVVGRVASVADITCNASGALLGAMLVSNPLGQATVDALHRFRERKLLPGPLGEMGLTLLALWFAAQLNPALPFFEAGNVADPTAGAPVARVAELVSLQAAGVALNVVGFALFIGVLWREPRGSLRAVALWIAIAALLKAMAAAVMLRPQMALAWMDMVNLSGLLFGLAAFAPLRKLGLRGRAYLGVLALLAGALISKATSFYDAAAELARLFVWPYGQIGNFATLTRWLSEVWPIATLLFLAVVFVAPPAQRRAE